MPKRPQSPDQHATSDVLPILWDQGVRLETLERLWPCVERQVKMLDIAVQDQDVQDTTLHDEYSRLDDALAMLARRVVALEERSDPQAPPQRQQRPEPAPVTARAFDPWRDAI